MRRRAFEIGIVAAAAVAAPAFASDVVERARVERLATSGHCDEALAPLTQRAAAEPRDAHAALMLGSCQLQLDRYEDAVVTLRRAKQLDPTLPDIDLQIATASFHADDYDGTLRAVADARAAGSTRPELDLYEGLALYGLQREPSAAAHRLEIAATRSGHPLDSVASYYAGMAWQNAGDSDRAHAALEKVIAEYPGSEWADAARRALEGSTTTAQSKRLWGFVRGGIEWDSNAAFLGRGVELPQELNQKDDFRGVLSAEIATQVWNRGPWALYARGDYYSSYDFDLTDFDLQYPGGGAWLDYAVHYGWLGYQPFVLANALTPQFLHNWGPAGTSRFWGQIYYDDFFDNAGGVAAGPGATGAPCVGTTVCGPPGLDEQSERNRDGYGGGLGIEHTVPVAWLKGEVWGGLFGEFYQSRGTEYQYDGYGARLGFSTLLPANFTLSAWGGYTHRPYRHPSTYPNPDNPQLLAGQQYALSGTDRNDNVAEVEVELSHPITRSLTGSIRYAYLNNDSNVAVYNYDSTVVGAYITWTFAR